MRGAGAPSTSGAVAGRDRGKEPQRRWRRWTIEDRLTRPAYFIKNRLSIRRYVCISGRLSPPGVVGERAAMACVADRAGVEALLRRGDLAPRVRERAEMVKAALLGQDVGWIAAWTGRAEQTVRQL